MVLNQKRRKLAGTRRERKGRISFPGKRAQILESIRKEEKKPSSTSKSDQLLPLNKVLICSFFFPWIRLTGRGIAFLTRQESGRVWLIRDNCRNLWPAQSCSGSSPQNQYYQKDYLVVWLRNCASQQACLLGKQESE